jgi:hypothetical protein
MLSAVLSQLGTVLKAGDLLCCPSHHVCPCLAFLPAAHACMAKVQHTV